MSRASAWDGLKGIDEDSIWHHLAGTTSDPLEVGDQRQIVVKVIDDRGNNYWL